MNRIMNPEEKQRYGQPEKIVEEWKKKRLEGTLPRDSEPVAGKQWRRLVIEDTSEGFIERNVPAAGKGGVIPLEQGMLVEINSKGVPVNETIKEQLDANPDGYTLESVE